MSPIIRFRDVLLLVILGAAGQFVALVIAAFFGASTGFMAQAAGIANGLCWIACYQRQARNYGWPSLRERFGAVRVKLLAAAGGTAVVLIVVLSAVTELLRGIGVPIADVPDLILPENRGLLLLLVIFVGLVGPIAEELMFRGVLLDWSRQKLPAGASILMVSLVFALLHDNHLRSGPAGWLGLAARFSLGAAASIFALRCRSLRPSVVLHATNNGLVVIFTVLASQP